MNKNLIFLFCTLLAMSSCTTTPKDGAESNTTEGTESQSGNKGKAAKVDKSQQMTDDYIIARVNSIYEAVFDEYNKAEEAESIPQSSPDEEYCSEDWNKTLMEVAEYDQQHNPDDIGFFDADYWVMGQDFSELSVSDIKAVKHDKENAVVELILHNGGSPTQVRLNLVYERGDWQIDNFIDIDNDLDWKKEMKDYLK